MKVLDLVMLTMLLISGLTLASTAQGKNAQGCEELVNKRDRTVLVKIPAGDFTLRAKKGHSFEQPARKVSLPAYYIAKNPVTNAQFRRFINATKHNAGEKWKKYAQKWGEQAPVVGIRFFDAQKYCAWAGCRLPTDAEWEKAALGDDGRKFPWGDTFDSSRAWVKVNSGGKAHPVGTKPAGASPYGCLDMYGNVFQWTGTRTGKQGALIRGMNYDGGPKYHDWRDDPISIGGSQVGFRCAKSDITPGGWRFSSGKVVKLELDGGVIIYHPDGTSESGFWVWSNDKETVLHYDLPGNPFAGFIHLQEGRTMHKRWGKDSEEYLTPLEQ